MELLSFAFKTASEAPGSPLWPWTERHTCSQYLSFSQRGQLRLFSISFQKEPQSHQVPWNLCAHKMHSR